MKLDGSAGGSYTQTGVESCFSQTGKGYIFLSLQHHFMKFTYGFVYLIYTAEIIPCLDC